RLAAAGDPKAAMKAYQQAGDRYAEAERAASGKREQRTAADSARAQMTTAKQRAWTEAPDYARGLESERQGSTQDSQNAFPEAAPSTRPASDLDARAVEPAKPIEPAKAIEPPKPIEPPKAAAPPSGANPRAEVRATLDSYVRAVETKDIGLLRQVRPGLTDEEINRTRASNEIKKSQKVDLKVDEITINGDQAQAVGRREDVISLKARRA